MRSLGFGLPLFLLLGFTFHANAVELGIGVSMKNCENSLFLPLKLNKNWLLEGQVQAMKMKQTVDGDGPTPSFTNSFLRAGLGIFWTRQVADKTRLMVGSRFSRVRRTFGSYGSEDSAQGLDVAPTVGVEFFPVRWLSIGGEVAYGFERITGSSNWNSSITGTSPDYHIRSQETRSALILRAYF